MLKLMTLSLASSVLASIVTFSHAADTKILFRYNSNGTLATKPPETDGGETNKKPRFIDGIVSRTTGSHPQSSAQPYVKVYGNGKYSGSGVMQFIATGFKSEPSISTNVPNSYGVIMPIPAGTAPEITEDSYLSYHMVNFNYGDNIKTGNITFTGDGETITTSFDLDRQDFDHAPLSISTASWPDLIDITSTEQRTFDTNFIMVRGGVPPYNAVLNVVGSSFPSDSMTPFTSENIIDALNFAADRGANFEIANSPMTEVELPLGPIIEANACSGEDGSISETSFSITISDSIGSTVKSPVQILRYTPNGPHCIRFWGLPRSY